MSLDRDATLKRAETLLRQGRLEAAIAEYRRVVDDQPLDWNTAGTLGDLYVRAGAPSQAVEQFARAAAHLHRDGSFQKAAALYKKILKIAPEDEATQVSLADACAAQGLLLEAKNCLTAVAARRRARGDTAGVEDVLRRLRACEAGDTHADAVEPAGVPLPGVLVTGAVLPPDAAGPDAALAAIEPDVDRAVEDGDFPGALRLLHEVTARWPGHVPSWLRLVELAVDGGLETAMFDAQAALADAYLDAGQAAEARVVAEDLLSHEPWDAAHAGRLRRALVMTGVDDPDAVVASVLQASGAAEGSLPAPQEGVSRAEEPMPFDLVEVDLTAALAELDGSAAPAPARAAATLDEVFHARRDESLRSADATHAAQQMRLGRTYLEIGMTDEALQAFRLAARWPTERFDASLAIARLFVGRGEQLKAIEWMERAAQVPAPTVEAGRSLLYDLAVALESSGETARALAVYLELQADAPRYRDVPTRVQRLARVEAGGSSSGS